MIDQNSSRNYGYVSGTADSYTIPRRTLDLADYLDIVRRHIHWVLGPAFLGLVLSVMVAFAWPDTYVSEATMRILPPQVPTNLIPTGIASQLVDRISAIQQQVMSRDGLVEIIRTHNLYPEDVKKKPMADIVEMMQTKISFDRAGMASRISGRKDASVAFRIRYSYSDKYAAQKVVRDIVDKCIRLTNQGQFDRASSTTQFLADQLNDAKRELDRIEGELTQFRMANQGRLPDQVDSNLTQLRLYQSNLDATTERVSRLGQEKIYLESQLSMVREQSSRVARNPEATTRTRVKSERLVQSERELMQMRAALSSLMERYTESHPDVKRMKGQIEVMERLRNQSLAEEEVKPDDENAPVVTAVASIDPQSERTIGEIEARLNLIDMTVQRETRRQAQLQDQISGFASRIESRPMIEQQYIGLTRDYSLAKSRYDDLSQKKGVSEMMTDLENRKQSELLEMLDQPSLPQRATDPNRLLIIGAGLAAGLFAGVLLVGVREIKDGSLKNLKDVRLYSNMAVLGSIPLLENDLVVRRKRRLVFLAWTTALLIGIAAMSASMYYYYFIAQR